MTREVGRAGRQARAEVRHPTPPWTLSLPQQMMRATPDYGRAAMDIVVWLRSLGLWNLIARDIVLIS
jgi:hypothetical protein